MYGPILCEKSCFSIIGQLKGAMEKLQSNKSLWRTRTTFEFFSSYNLIIVFLPCRQQQMSDAGKKSSSHSKKSHFLLDYEKLGSSSNIKVSGLFPLN